MEQGSGALAQRSWGVAERAEEQSGGGGSSAVGEGCGGVGGLEGRSGTAAEEEQSWAEGVRELSGDGGLGRAARRPMERRDDWRSRRGVGS